MGTFSSKEVMGRLTFQETPSLSAAVNREQGGTSVPGGNQLPSPGVCPGWSVKGGRQLTLKENPATGSVVLSPLPQGGNRTRDAK